MSFTYNDRELSNLDFISRVLSIASNPKVPLIERFRYVCISCSFAALATIVGVLVEVPVMLHLVSNNQVKISF